MDPIAAKTDRSPAHSTSLDSFEGLLPPDEVTGPARGSAPEPVSLVGTPEALSLLDASFLYLERPTELLHVGAVALLASTPPFEALVATLAERLGGLRRYRQVPERPFLDWRLPVWRDAEDFDVRRHVQRTVLTAPGDEAALQPAIDALFARPLPADRPLWECHVIERIAEGRAAVLIKVHHCMIDGVSGVQVLDLLTGGARPPGQGSAEPRPDGREGLVARAGDGSRASAGDSWTARAGEGWLATALDAVAAPGRALGRVQEAVAAGRALAGFALGSSAPFPWNGALGSARAVRWQSFPLERLLAMRGAAGCKVNDIALAVIAGAMRALLPPAACAAGRRPRALVPVNLRHAGEHLTLGNRISGRFASLPLDVADPRERLRLIAGDMREQKAPGRVQAFDVALAVAGALPATLTPWIAHLNDQWPVVHTVCTNVPGPSEPRLLAGAPVLAIHPIVPLALGIGLGFAMLSYAGEFSIVATADPALVPEIDRLPAALAAAADELAASLGVGAPPARTANTPAPTVGDLMTRTVTTIAPDTRLGVVWKLMQSRRIRHLPVVDGAGCLRGLLTHRDVLAALPSSLGDDGPQAPLLAFGWAEARDLMETHLSLATADEPAHAAGRRMAEHKIGCLPVVGARGELVGIVTETDFLHWATEHMAERG